MLRPARTLAVIRLLAVVASGAVIAACTDVLSSPFAAALSNSASGVVFHIRKLRRVARL